MKLWFLFKKTQKNLKTRKIPFFNLSFQGRKHIKKAKKRRETHKKHKKIKIFLFEKQLLIKNFTKKDENILEVSKNVVPLHPQSREIATE